MDAKALINDLLGALTGIEWTAGSSPSQEIMEAIRARAQEAIKKAAAAGIEYRPNTEGATASA